MSSNINHADLLNWEWDKTQVLQWLKEDIPSFDYGGFVVGILKNFSKIENFSTFI